VETVARRGYRFLAEVKVADSAPVRSQDLATEPHPVAEARDRLDLAGKPAMLKHLLSSFAWKAPALVLLLLVASLAGWKLHSWKRPSLVIRSLAVLPLESLSSDASQDYFADGMTDELISDLGQISALRVISRTSVMAYKRARKPLPQIARELNVDAVVEAPCSVPATRSASAGAVDRSAPRTSTYGPRAIRVNCGILLHSQNQVARAIADQIRINLNPQEQAALKNVKVVNPQAYESFSKGATSGTNERQMV